MSIELFFVGLMWGGLLALLGPRLWRAAAKWLRACPFLHTDKCLNGAWKDGGCECDDG